MRGTAFQNSIISLSALFFIGCAPTTPDETGADITLDELKAHIEFLAQPSMKGRKAGSPESAEVRKYIKGQFADFGLKPWAETKNYDQPFTYGTNLIGVLSGSDPDFADQIVLICAHYDHLGTGPDGYYPGASDNASGVAALLEIAEKVSFEKDRPKRTICFAAFDAEEPGSLGAFAFTRRDDYENSKISSVINIDMLGRSFLGMVYGSLFVVGSENYPEIKKEVVQVGENFNLKIITVNSVLLPPVGDHRAFTSDTRPVLFFSCGIFPDYHKITDTPDKINYTLVNKQTHVVYHCVQTLAGSGFSRKNY